MSSALTLTVPETVSSVEHRSSLSSTIDIVHRDRAQEPNITTESTKHECSRSPLTQTGARSRMISDQSSLRPTTPRAESPVSSPLARNRRPLKKRARAIKVWKPLDLRDQVELDNSITAEYPQQQSSSSSFDVHAKTFRPSSVIPNDSECRSVLLGTPPTPDEITMHEPIQSSGLNAYEIKSDAVNASVTACVNQRELTAVFGGDLPSPDVCQTHPGQANGQVQFCIHPNGDVSAHQWSSAGYQWLNIGQFSNIRKRTEGQLASDRLRGETESQSLQQNTLAYFRVVAMQRESSVMRPDKMDPPDMQRLSILGNEPALQVHGVAQRSRSEDSAAAAFKRRGRLGNTSDGARSDLTRQHVQAASPLDVEEVRPKRRLNDFIKGIMMRQGSQLKISQTAGTHSDATPIVDTLPPTDGARQRGTDSVKRSVLHDPLRGKFDSEDDVSLCESVSGRHGTSSKPGRAVDEQSVLDRSLPDGTVGEAEPSRGITAPRWGMICGSVDSRPTPQNFNGPFFADEAPQPARRSRQWAEELDKWFKNGSEAERQEDYFNTIVALCGNQEPDFDPTITRLMIPVVENLMGYTQSPAKAAMTRFTTPPEWCIDRSPSGNRSLFEQDCGRVPQRIGRDERYRHLAYEGRHADRRRVSPRVPAGLRFV